MVRLRPQKAVQVGDARATGSSKATGTADIKISLDEVKHPESSRKKTPAKRPLQLPVTPKAMPSWDPPAASATTVTPMNPAALAGSPSASMTDSTGKKQKNKKKRKSKDRHNSIIELSDDEVPEKEAKVALPKETKESEKVVEEALEATPGSSEKKKKKKKKSKDRKSIESISGHEGPSSSPLTTLNTPRQQQGQPTALDSDMDIEVIIPKKKGEKKGKGKVSIVLTSDSEAEQVASTSKGKKREEPLSVQVMKRRASLGREGDASGQKAPKNTAATPPSRAAPQDDSPGIIVAKRSKKRSRLASDDEENDDGVVSLKTNAVPEPHESHHPPEQRDRKRLKKSHPPFIESETTPVVSPAPKGKPISPPATTEDSTQEESKARRTTKGQDTSLQDEVELLRKRIESRDLELKRLERENRRLRDALAKVGKSPEKVLQQSEILTCAICTELIAVPSTLRCGHTFCFECLHTSLQTKKACPSCRELVSAPPSESLLITYQIDEYVERLEDANERETEKRRISEKLKEYKKAKQGKNLWGDVSKPQPVRDHDEGVWRCAECAWELEGATCNSCGTVHSLTEGNYPFQAEEWNGDGGEEDEEGGGEDLNYSDDEISIDYGEEEEEDDDSFVVDDDVVEFEDDASDAEWGEIVEDHEQADGWSENGAVDHKDEGDDEEEEEEEEDDNEDEEDDDDEDEEDDDDDDYKDEDEDDARESSSRSHSKRTLIPRGRTQRSKRVVSPTSSEDEGDGNLLNDLLDD